MGKLIDTAEALMDMYYQNYRSDEDFFTLDHFVYICGVIYSKLLEDEYNQERAITKAVDGFTNVLLATDWLTKETVTPVKVGRHWVATLKHRPVSFPFDHYSFGLQRIVNNKSGCRRFIRTSAQAEWKQDIMPKTDRVFFYGQGREIVFLNARCELKTPLDIYYAVEISDGDPAQMEVPQGKEFTILRFGLDLMKRAREGEVVDMSNNSNPNKTIQTEIDTTFSNLRTKPI